jgi:hypothetical protein
MMVVGGTGISGAVPYVLDHISHTQTGSRTRQEKLDKICLGRQSQNNSREYWLIHREPRLESHVRDGFAYSRGPRWPVGVRAQS